MTRARSSFMGVRAYCRFPTSTSSTTRQHIPDLADVAHLVKDVYPSAIKRLDSKTVTTFLAWKIKENYGAVVLDDFLMALLQSDLPDGHPVATLQRRLNQHRWRKSWRRREVPAKSSN